MNSGGEQFATLQRLVLKIIRGLDYRYICACIIMFWRMGGGKEAGN